MYLMDITLSLSLSLSLSPPLPPSLPPSLSVVHDMHNSMPLSESL